MMFDIVLPLSISLISLISLFTFSKYGDRIESLFGERKLQLHEVVLIVILLSVVVTLIIFLPDLAIKIAVIGAHSLLQFVFLDTVTSNRYIALSIPAIFVISYIFFWNNILLNLFASLTIIGVTLVSSILFTWKIAAIFTALLTVMDFTHVFITRSMVASTSKMTGLELPIAIILPTFPISGSILLGLGDLFLSGLLTIQTFKKYGLKSGIISAIFISAFFFIAETLFFTFEVKFFPATLVIAAGWATSLLMSHKLRS